MTSSSKQLLRRELHALSKTYSVCDLPSKNPQDYVRLLSSCKYFNSLLQIHAQLIVSALLQHTSINTHLINSYSFFQNSHSARLVFDSAPSPSVVLYNSIIRAYTRGNQHKEALKMYHLMIQQGLEPNKYTFIFVLKACTALLDVQEGVSVHNEIVNKGLECDVFVATGLVDMYSKMGNLSLSREVFDKMPDRDVVAWNAIIAGLSQSSDPYEALEFFKCMQFSGVEPDLVSFFNLVPAVSKLGNLCSCRSIHGYVIRRGLDKNFSNGLIDIYSKCGDVHVARCIFNQMQMRDAVSWGTMMAGYAHYGYFVEVMELFDQMNRNNLITNKASAVAALSAAGEMRDLEKGKEIHDCVIKQNFDIDIATSIISMYAKCGELEKAKKLFGELQERDLVAWSAIIGAFVQSGYPEEALCLFQGMQNSNVRPNSITLISFLPACGEPLYLRLGKSIHCYAVKANFDSDISTGTSLVSMYAKCGFMRPAFIIFNRMPFKDVVTWNALINGYTQIGHPNYAIQMFHELELSEINPDSRTMVGLLSACVNLNDQGLGSSIHGKIIRYGIGSDSHVMNALLDMYAKCGNLSSAKMLFYRADFPKDEVSWNIIIAGFLQNGNAKESISAFHHMRLGNWQPNVITIVSVLPATAYLAALRAGMGIHACIIQMGFQSNTLVGNSLIDMYAKCGRLKYAEKCFNEMENKDTVSWNAMLAGYAIHGQGSQAIALFSLMQERQFRVDSVTFLNVLSACRHSGLVQQGKEVFDSICKTHHIAPDMEHYACMVDLLVRAGLFGEAWDFISKMPIKPDAGVWGALISACRMHSNVQLGEIALDHLVQLEPENPTHYVVLTNIYAQSGRWEDASNTKSKMNQRGLTKTPGCSWVEVKNKIHAFRAGDQSHPQLESMQRLWSILLEKMEQMAYVPDTSCVSRNVEEEDKELFLYNHSERLAIVFALLNTEPGSTILIVKNLRACTDCHTTIKLITKITRRQIIVRDATRFHQFKDGICSCNDYW
ncbi:pentatricopeptide repeat-containing protein At2g39620 [Mangifera indica]|uniref:pentatricopeptide repeat-containing protein At2g39620 n=1 Tax=Mangifera indica TaxID=29780 RepID=UPI001CFAA902|nr:pentatricopeptide repeat-containing protein At2g39620 [Mangifera indica]